MQMVRFDRENVDAMGRSTVRLMWAHHVISMLMWPYAVLTHSCCFFVAFFLFTEVSVDHSTHPP